MRSANERAVAAFGVMVLAVVGSGFGRTTHGPPNRLRQGSGGPPAIPRELLERPLPLRSGIGPVHEDVTTTSKEAQARMAS